MGDLSTIEIIYWGSTIIGGTLFILRTVMLVIGGGIGHEDFDAGGGGDFDGDLDIDHDMHFDVDHPEAVTDSDFSFKLLSMQGLTAFFMMFGLVGLALHKAGTMVAVSVLGGGLAGMFAVWVISMVFSQLKRLQSDGTVNIQNAIGQSGSVYLPIPAKGTGQVRVTVQGALKVYDALSKDAKKILVGEKIRVTGVINDNTLEVEKI